MVVEPRMRRGVLLLSIAALAGCGDGQDAPSRPLPAGGETDGGLAGVPVAMEWQPRWWLKVELRLDDSGPASQ